jgi:hypothetical protein
MNSSTAALVSVFTNLPEEVGDEIDSTNAVMDLSKAASFSTIFLI